MVRQVYPTSPRRCDSPDVSVVEVVIELICVFSCSHNSPAPFDPGQAETAEKAEEGPAQPPPQLSARYGHYRHSSHFSFWHKLYWLPTNINYTKLFGKYTKAVIVTIPS